MLRVHCRCPWVYADILYILGAYHYKYLLTHTSGRSSFRGVIEC